MKTEWEIKSRFKIKSNRDKCVSCQCETQFDKDTHVDLRHPYYIEGAGQLCVSCYNKVYNITTTENT
jgi:hypothetical protein